MLKSKSGYKKVKWLFGNEIKIPKKWNMSTIADTCNILDSQRIPLNSETRKKMVGSIPYYGANGVQGYVNRHIFNEELILLAEDGGYFDEYQNRPIAYYVTGKSWVNNHAHVLTAKYTNHLKWVFYSLVHKNILPWINGSTRAKLNQSDLKQIKILIPLKDEQQRIASILSGVDATIEATQKVIEKTERLKKGLMQKLLTRGIEHTKFKKVKGLFGKEIEIPEEWEIKQVKEIFEFLKTGTNSRNDLAERGDVRYIHYGDIHQKWYLVLDCNSTEIPFIAKKKIKNVSLLQNGDLIIADASEDHEGSGTSVLIKNIGGKKIVSGLHTLALRDSSDHTASEFRAYITSIKFVKNQIIAYVTGISVYGLSKTNLKNIKIPIPSVTEQTKIASILSGVDANSALSMFFVVLHMHLKYYLLGFLFYNKLLSQHNPFNLTNENTKTASRLSKNMK